MHTHAVTKWTATAMHSCLPIRGHFFLILILGRLSHLNFNVARPIVTRLSVMLTLISTRAPKTTQEA